MEKKFNNPYNFIRTTSADIRKEARDLDLVDASLYSGVIHCEIKAKTPLAVGGKHSEKDNWVPFFRLVKESGGNPVIPGSTIRGVIRSIFEAITNSCMLFYDAEDFEGKREAQSPGVGIVKSLPEDDDNPGKILLGDDYLVVPHVLEEAGINLKHDKFKTIRVAVKTASGHSENGKKRGFQRWIQEIRRLKDKEEAKPGEQVGYLNLTSNAQTGEDEISKIPKHIKEEAEKAGKDGVTVSYIRRKRENARDTNIPHLEKIFERTHYYTGTLFCYNEQFSLKPHQKSVVVIPKNPEKIMDFPLSVSHTYLHLNRHGERAKEIKKGENLLKLREGDVIYFPIEDKEKKEVSSIFKAKLSKKAFPSSVSGRMTEFEKPCWLRHVEEKLEESNTPKGFLCPACQVFGYVADKRQQYLKAKEKAKTQNWLNEQKIISARAGRLYFSHATLTGPQVKGESKTLQILGSPKPSCTPFYLVGNDGSPHTKFCELDSKNKPQVCEYNENHIRRGRKCYIAYDPEKSHLAQNIERKDLHSTPEILPKGTTFGFDITFLGLEKWELGALVLSLTLNDKAYHGIGMGKPLGMGACQIAINDIQLEAIDRYLSLTGNGFNKGTPEFFKEAFISYWKEKTGEDFYASSSWKDFVTLRSINLFKDVEYPTEVVEKGKNRGQNMGFQWFVNHAYCPKPKKDFQPLPLAQELETKKLTKTVNSGR